MKFARVITAALLMALPLHGAFALSIDDKTANTAGAANYTDPDDQQNPLGVQYNLTGNANPDAANPTATSLFQPCSGTQPCPTSRRR